MTFSYTKSSILTSITCPEFRWTKGIHEIGEEKTIRLFCLPKKKIYFEYPNPSPPLSSNFTKPIKVTKNLRCKKLVLVIRNLNVSHYFRGAPVNHVVGHRVPVVPEVPSWVLPVRSILPDTRGCRDSHKPLVLSLVNFSNVFLCVTSCSNMELLQEFFICFTLIPNVTTFGGQIKKRENNSTSSSVERNSLLSESTDRNPWVSTETDKSTSF